MPRKKSKKSRPKRKVIRLKFRKSTSRRRKRISRSKTRRRFRWT